MNDDPAYPVALLRIALALKLHPDTSFDEIIEQTTRSMGLSKAVLRNYLALHMEMLGRKSRAAREKSAVAVVSSRSARRSRTRSPR